MQRIKRVQKILAKEKVDFLILSDPITIFYLSHVNLSFGRLVITPKDASLFTDKRYLEFAEKRAPCRVAFYETQNELIKGGRRVAFDSSRTSYKEFISLSSSYKDVVPLPLSDLRGVKEKEEVKLLKASVRLNFLGYEYLLSKLKNGITEKELSIAFKIFALEKGAEVSFEPIIAFGKNSSEPHHESGQTTLKPGDNVLIDIGVVLNGYVSDMTRTTFWKKPSSEMKRFDALVKKAYRAAFEACRVGVKVKALDMAARAVFKREGVEDYFLHSLGHGVGLEVHEFPRINSTGDDRDVELKSGMVFTIEPGLYLKGVGGVRYENIVLVNATGAHEF